ncbi:MAG: PIG-L deacetylase family protein [Anaerolineales bacterium]
MDFNLDTAEIFVPDDLAADLALARTTHIGIGAHQDDLEIMAFDGILACFQSADRWFSGVVVTDGSGSPRAGPYERYTDDEMRLVRIQEQKKAAVVGEYAAQVFLDYPSSDVKDGNNEASVEDLIRILRVARPEVIYTHNLADKHDTHVAVALRVIDAVRTLPEGDRPKSLYGCEVWRDLDWLADEDKVVFDISAHENLQAALLGVFDSQISGGKRYDLATMGRRRANATYFASHGTDVATGMAFAMDLTPLVRSHESDVSGYLKTFTEKFVEDMNDRLLRLKSTD